MRAVRLHHSRGQGRGEVPQVRRGADAAQGRCAGSPCRTAWDVYEKQTKPLIDFYAEKGRLKNVDGSKPLAEVNRGHSGGPWEQLDDHIQNASRD